MQTVAMVQRPGVKNEELGLYVWIDGDRRKVLARPGALTNELEQRLAGNRTGEMIQFVDEDSPEQRFILYEVPEGDSTWLDCYKYASLPNSINA